MKNTLALLLIICLFIARETTAQNNGFYGKKVYVEFNGLGNIALFHHTGTYDTRFYKNNGSTLTQGSDWFNSGFNLGAGIATKRDFMIGLETSWWFFNVAGPTSLNYESSSLYGPIYLRHEMLDMRTFSIMPTLTFGGKKGLLPVGINHQVGIAYTRTKALDHDYLFRPDNDYYYSVTQEELDSLSSQNGGLVDYEEVFAGFSLVYTLKVRIPVSKSVMINYGFRYSLNYTSLNHGYSDVHKMSNTVLQEEIRRARFRSPLSFSIGVTLAL
jgi:hypothetical protein